MVGATCVLFLPSLPLLTPLTIQSTRLGDEGSAYAVGRLAMRSILTASDTLRSTSFLSPSSPSPPLLPLHASLLKHFGVPSAAALVAKTYGDHSTSPLHPSFEQAEANRKVWIAEAARIVLAYAFAEDGSADDESRAVALGIAGVAASSMVDLAAVLLGRDIVEPKKAALALGGGLWKAEGYCDLVVKGLRERGVEFAAVVVVGDPAEAGVLALVAQGVDGA